MKASLNDKKEKVGHPLNAHRRISKINYADLFATVLLGY